MSCVTISTVVGFLFVTNFVEDQFLLRLWLEPGKAGYKMLDADTNIQLQENLRTTAYIHVTILKSIDRGGQGGRMKEYSRQIGVHSGDGRCKELDNG